MTKLAKDVRFDEDLMWVDFTDGSCLGVNLAHFPRLLRATPEQRAGVVISGGGQGCTGMPLMKMSTWLI